MSRHKHTREWVSQDHTHTRASHRPQPQRDTGAQKPLFSRGDGDCYDSRDESFVWSGTSLEEARNIFYTGGDPEEADLTVREFVEMRLREADRLCEVALNSLEAWEQRAKEDRAQVISAQYLRAIKQAGDGDECIESGFACGPHVGIGLLWDHLYTHGKWYRGRAYGDGCEAVGDAWRLALDALLAMQTAWHCRRELRTQGELTLDSLRPYDVLFPSSPDSPG